jgi:protein-disulfide isomerase
MIRITAALAAFFLAVPAIADDAPAPAPAPAAQAPVAQAPAKPFVYTPKPTDIVIGKEKAPVVIVEYASLSCPHCAHFFVNSLPTLTTRYIDTGKAKLLYRHYPLNEPALKAAELVQCADPDRRHAFLDVLFSTQGKWAYDANFKESLATTAVLGGIARAKFDACMNDKELEKSILEVTTEAQDDFKVSSTPTFFINNKKEEGDHSAESLGKEIDSALAKTAKKK